jgi:predicted RNA-binding Zn-ribbon protein involved in translation (DUF1610 family)
VLGGLDNQRRFILREYSTPCPCPNCGTEQNVFQALDIDIDDWDTNHGGATSGTCIGCGRQIRLAVPLVKLTPPHWEWHLVPIAPTKEPA